MHRHYSAIDKFLVEVDKGIRTVYARPCGSGRANPAGEVTEDTDALSNSDRELAARLMRINHAGEVSAQGLYQGQALTARSQIVRNQMNKSATEENDHLVWCDQRLQELGGQKSHLGPMWYMGSFCIGALAGLVGDRWSL